MRQVMLGLAALLLLLFAGFGMMMCVMASESLVVGGSEARWGWYGFAAMVVGVPLLMGLLCLLSIVKR